MDEHPNVAIVKRPAKPPARATVDDVATPADWNVGENVIILAALSDNQAREHFPDGWDAPKPYLRFVPQPGR